MTEGQEVEAVADRDSTGEAGANAADSADAAGAFAPDPTAAGADAADTGALSFTATEEDAGARLDAFLAARVPAATRSRLKQWIDDGEVLVSGSVVRPSHRLRAGETIELDTPGPLVHTAFAPEDIPLDIVYEDDAIAVVNKPAGLVVHPAAGTPAGTLANALAFHFRQLAAGGDPARPGIVHRLDRDTSGLIAVAKTDEAHESLSAQFRAREVVKYYVALAHGATKEERGHVEEPLGRDPQNRTRMAVVRGGRHAHTIWRVRRRFTRYTLLDVDIKTGRTHQIRVHLAWLKHPVVGDAVYGGGRDNTIQDARVRSAVQALGRQFLHAERLGFRHPRTGEFMKFRAPLAPDLTALLEQIEGQ